MTTTARVGRHYRLARRPGVSTLVPARAYVVPLSDAADHRRIRHLQPTQRTPVLLDHFQYVALLSDIADQLWAALGPDTRVFMQVRSSFIGSLPANLTDPRVLLGTRLADKAHAWAVRRQLPAVSIVDAIRRDLDCPGDNTVHCVLSGSDDRVALDAAWLRSGRAQAVQFVAAGQAPLPPIDNAPRGAGAP